MGRWNNVHPMEDICVWWMVSARHWEHDQNFHSQQLWHLHLRYVSVNIKSENLVVIYFDIFVCLVRQIFSTELVFVMPSLFRHQILNLWTLITFLSHLDIKSHEHRKTLRSTLLSLVALSELFFSCRQPAPVSSLPPAMRRRSFSHINICTLCVHMGHFLQGGNFGWFMSLFRSASIYWIHVGEWLSQWAMFWRFSQKR